MQEAAGEDLATGLAEVLGQEGVEDGVDAGVSIRKAVGNDTKGKSGVIQGKGAELHPHGDDVVGHPADGEGGDNQENRLSRLQEHKENLSESARCGPSKQTRQSRHSLKLLTFPKYNQDTPQIQSRHSPKLLRHSPNTIKTLPVFGI